jgi:nicotinamidase-related amidase
MPENLETIGQDSLFFDAREATRGTTLTARDADDARTEEGRYLDPISSALPRPEMTLDVNHAALIVIDPQIDFSSLKCGSSGLHENAAELRTIQNLVRLTKAAMLARIPFAVSLTAPRELRSDFVPDLKKYVEDGNTIICSPHLVDSQLRVNDVGLRLRKQRIHQIVLAGVIASLPIEAHLRDFIEQGFEVAVVRDAVAGARLPEGVGYLSALVNFRCIINALWTTDETIQRLG